MSAPIDVCAGDLDDPCMYREAAERYLAALMSELSEDAVCATWEHRMAHSIWNCGDAGGPAPWGMLDDERAQCERLVALGKALDCWWTWLDGGHGPIRMSIEEWRRHHAGRNSDEGDE